MTDPTEDSDAAAPSAATRPALTQRRRAFIDEYLIDFNATQAAVRAGYKKNSAHTLGSRLLQVPAVKAALDAAIATRAARTRVTADRVIEEYARLAFADMRRFAEWNKDGMSLRSHTALSAADAAAVVELAPVGAKGRTRIKLFDKRPALDALARHLGLFGIGGTFGQRIAADPNKQREEAREALRRQILRVIAERKAKAASPAAEEGGVSGGEDADSET